MVPQELRIEFRIGIHVGDIIIDENDIFSDGVNIAARLVEIHPVMDRILPCSEAAKSTVSSTKKLYNSDAWPLIRKTRLASLRLWFSSRAIGYGPLSHRLTKGRAL